MKTRTLTGLIFITVMIASLMFGAYTFSALILVLSVLTLNEFYRLICANGIVQPQKFGGTLILISIFFPLCQHLMNKASSANLLLAVPCVIMVIILELYRKQKLPFHNLAYTLFGVLFAALPFCFFYALAFTEGSYNLHYPLGFLILLWAHDTGAYLFGFYWGKHKLFERYSPKKSWEGFFGGMFTSLLSAFILSKCFNELALIHWLAFSLIIVVIGTLGDLTESMLKRSLNVKDSSTLLPGHGGLLDRFDGLLLTAPLIFVYVHFIVARG